MPYVLTFCRQGRSPTCSTSGCSRLQPRTTRTTSTSARATVPAPWSRLPVESAGRLISALPLLRYNASPPRQSFATAYTEYGGSLTATPGQAESGGRAPGQGGLAALQWLCGHTGAGPPGGELPAGRLLGSASRLLEFPPPPPAPPPPTLCPAAVARGEHPARRPQLHAIASTAAPSMILRVTAQRR